MKSRKVYLIAVLVLVITTAGCVGPINNIVDSDDTNTQDPEDNSLAESNLEITWIDSGQGDSILINSNRSTMLVDTGDWRDDGDHTISYLEENNVNSIDALVTTHPDADHIGGHERVIDKYGSDGIGGVYGPGVTKNTNTFEEYLDAVDRQGLKINTVQEGDKIPFDGASVKVLNPPSQKMDSSNDNSVVLLIKHGSQEILLTGDIESEAERRIVESYDLDNTELVQAPHHGSSSSSTIEFVSEVKPEYVVYSSAIDSQYGHPHEEVVLRYNDIGSEGYWTGEDGDITFISDGESLDVKTQK